MMLLILLNLSCTKVIRCNYIESKQSYSASLSKCMETVRSEEGAMRCIRQERTNYASDGLMIKNTSDCIEAIN